jgi:hypothetical protein
MGVAFDQACLSLRHLGWADKVRALIAKRIIEAAINGERDPIRLRSQGLMGFSIDDLSMPDDGVGRSFPSPAYVPVAHSA